MDPRTQLGGIMNWMANRRVGPPLTEAPFQFGSDFLVPQVPWWGEGARRPSSEVIVDFHIHVARSGR